MAIYSYLDISTAYMTALDNQKLTDGIDGPPHAPTAFGWWVWAGDDTGAVDAAWRFHCMSDDFIGVLAYARQNGCQYVNFDRDGDDDVLLAQHDW